MIARVVTSVLVLVVGVVVGTVGTIAHQSVMVVFGTRLPVGLVLASIAVACLLAGLRLVDRSRLFALLGALGVVAPIALFSVRGAGGSVIIPENATGIAWTIGAAAISAVAVAWPRLRPRDRTSAERGGPGGGT